LSNYSNKAWHIGFSMIPGVGRARIALLENYFGDLYEAWRANIEEFSKVGLDTATVQSIASWRPKIEPERELEKC
jgi:DNA processing protein